MGIGFVLLIWALLLGCAGVPAAVVLGVWSWRAEHRSRPNRGLVRPIAAALLPFILLLYGGVTFIAYGIWCEKVRHVDAGIGDSWMVPVGNDHFLCMIDIPEHGYLLKGGCSGSPAISDIVELAEVEDRIVGRSSSKGLFVFNTRSGELHPFLESEAVQKEISPLPTLQSANAFYMRRRWGWLDLLAVSIIGSLGAAIMFLWYRLFIRAPSAI